MLLVLVNIIILLLGIAGPISILFWKHFSKTPGEYARATIATLISMLGLAVFFTQTLIMTTQPGENIITIIINWLSG